MTSIQAGYRFGSRGEDVEPGTDDGDEEDHADDGPRRGSSATDKTLFSRSTTNLNGTLKGFSPLKKGSPEDAGDNTGTMKTASSSMTKVDSFFDTVGSKKDKQEVLEVDLESGSDQGKGRDERDDASKTLHQELNVDNVELYRILETEGLILDKIDVDDTVAPYNPPRFVLVAAPPDHHVDGEYAPVHPMPKTFSTARKTVIVCLASWITVLVCMCASGFSTGAHIIRDEFGLIELEGMEERSGHSSEWVWGTFGGLGLYLVSLGRSFLSARVDS